jgi:hypothetical protein
LCIAKYFNHLQDKARCTFIHAALFFRPLNAKSSNVANNHSAIEVKGNIKYFQYSPGIKNRWNRLKKRSCEWRIIPGRHNIISGRIKQKRAGLHGPTRSDSWMEFFI